MKQLLQLLCIVALCASPALAQGPVVSVPPYIDDAYSLYVFGPRGGAMSGREDSVQVLFARVPADSAGTVTFYVYDPASGSDMEKRSSFLSEAITTTFSVYGGEGAFTASQTTRPAVEQSGTVLSEGTFGEQNRDEWVSFGPHSRADGETVDGYTYYKIVAVATDGRGPNMYRVGASSPAVEFFAYDLTTHFAVERGEMMRYQVEIPANIDAVVEKNFDIDQGGIVYIEDVKLRASRSGKWRRNVLNVQPTNTTTRLPYTIVKHTQGYANAGFYFETTDGQPLKIFFAPAPAPAPGGNCSTANSFMVAATKCMPVDATINEEFSYTLRVEASGHAGNVVLRDKLMDGVRYVSSDPEATKNGDTLTWAWEQLHEGDVKDIVVKVVPETEGELKNCITIKSDPILCTTTIAGSPKLAITKTGPAQALIGSQVPYSITVSNTGTGVARDVVVTDKLPAALSHASQQKALRYEIGDMEPGTSRQIPLEVAANQRGRHCNEAVAEAGNAATVNAQACTQVVEQMLEVTKTGTKVQFLGKVANYKIVVKNPGDVDLTNVVVVDTPPGGTRIVEAPGASITGNLITWTIDRLPAGTNKEFSVKLTSRLSGKHCNSVSVTTAENQSAQAQACTDWKGHPALLLEVIDTVDPLLPGEKTTYIISVTNQGTAPDHNVSVVANFPAQVSPTAASGSTEPTVAGKKVTTAAFPVLEPGARIEWKIEAKADQAGDSRLKVGLTSDLLKTPVNEEESTHVY